MTMYKYQSVSCLLLIIIGQYCEGISIMSYHYIQEANTWLRLHRVPATWTDARLRCQLEGGVLASPTDRALTKEMLSMMAEHKLMWQSIFVGIHAFVSKGNFMSMDGVPLANLSLEWADGEPDNKNNDEDCLTMTGAGALADVSCSSVHAYFCSKESAKMTLNKCGTTDNEYKHEPRTGSCYKFHLIPRTWPQAEAACAAEGGHLAVINSPTESQVLREMFAQHPDNVIRGAKYTHVAMIGFWDWKDHARSGEWLTIFDETLTEAGFAVWEENEPNNAFGREYCGSIVRSGLLNDFECELSAVFICEISPK